MALTLKHDNLKASLGDKDHLELSEQISFAEMIFRVLSEKKPSESELKLFELILNLSIDHGPDTPSAIKTIEATKTGSNISESVAEGIKMISDVHGGAIEPAMNFFYQISKDGKDVKSLVNEYLEEHKLIGGFGHRIYKDSDPRAQLILKKIKELGMSKDYINISLEVEKEIESNKQTHLPLNIDGAIAVLLCTFGWDSKLGKAVFIIARTPGLCAHFINNS